MRYEDVCLTIPTRGDVDLAPILAELPPFGEVVVWDNSVREDLGIYGRYAAIALTSCEVICTQDDDLLVPCWAEILERYVPGRLVCNYPEPWDIPWVARGAIFDRELPELAFAPYLARWPMDRYFTHYICDAVFGLLAPEVEVVYYGGSDLSHGFAAGRVSTEPGWYDDRRPRAQRRCAAIRQQEVLSGHH